MPIVELIDVKKKYQMGKVFVPAVKNVNFSIEKGELAAISGPSGSGKSTTLNIIGLVDLPSSGTVILDGIDIYGGYKLPEGGVIPSALDRRITEIRSSHVGFIFQNFNLIPALTFLHYFSKEISKPANEDELNYIPTQIFTEFIRFQNLNIKGIKYNSSKKKGKFL